MSQKTLTRLAGYLSLSVMLLSSALYFLGTQAWPYLLLLIVSSWLHGICWGRLYSLEGRLTWF